MILQKGIFFFLFGEKVKLFICVCVTCTKMTEIYIDDIDKVCRGCLGKKGEMRPLYGSCLDTMLMTVAEIDVCGKKPFLYNFIANVHFTFRFMLVTGYLNLCVFLVYCK